VISRENVTSREEKGRKFRATSFHFIFPWIIPTSNYKFWAKILFMETVPQSNQNQSRQRKKPPPSPARVQGRGGRGGRGGGGNNARKKDEKKSSPQPKDEKNELPQPQQLAENGEDVIRLGAKLENAALDDGEASDEESSEGRNHPEC
jgi:hypothetical protein